MKRIVTLSGSSLLTLITACRPSPDAPTASVAPVALARSAAPAGPPRPEVVASVTPPAAASVAAPSAAVDWAKAPYPWLAGAAPDAPGPVEPLTRRYAPPDGFTRVEVAPESFGAWLRGLPLTAAGTPVRTYRGAVLRETNHPYVASVVAIDVGTADLQQCADSVIRLHAEWRWSTGDRAESYRASSGTAMPFARWARGERLVARGNTIDWTQSGTADDSHASFRRYLDAVFTWANTGSLSRDAARVKASDLRPGDFFVMPGSPGHAVLVLDLARAPDGRRRALLGQGFMPAQSFHVLKSASGSEWFAVDEAQAEVTTPFWEPFPWSTLRRLDGSS